MQLSETVKLYQNIYQKMLISDTMDEYIATVNSLISFEAGGVSIKKFTSADISANLKSALKCQCVC